MNPTRIALIAALLPIFAGCDRLDPNSRPIYAKDSGLPVNCRAYVQAAVDGYRQKRFTAEEMTSGLERNCGINGYSWDAR